MKHFRDMLNLPAILLLSYLVFMFFRKPDISDTFILIALSSAYCFHVWVEFKKSTTMLKNDDFEDLHKSIRKAQLEKQLFQANNDIVKLNAKEGASQGVDNGKVIF